ncbi:unnamed protein product [Vicia faba]|uniref:Uncharacterized protein n=1 Tax=Vicia faba TaxID=3906 RepID=A0AAV1B6Z4_VICFA|nr:unnamed protein product [Vicia faba]
MQPKHPLSKRNLERRTSKSMEKTPKLTDYDRNGDLDEHVKLVDEWFNYFGADDTSKCKLFVLTMEKTGERKVKFVHEMLTVVEPFMILEEKLTAHFDNPTSSESYSGLSSKKNITDVRMILTETCKGNMTDTLH